MVKERRLSVKQQSLDRLQPGMVVNYESQYFLPYGAGLCLQIDTIMFTEEEGRITSTVPREIAIKY